MKIIYPYPAYWPYMRRGAERCIHDITNYLARRGHEVDIVTSKPGRARMAYDGPVRVLYLKQVSHPLSYKYTPLLRLYAFGAQATAHMIRGNYDVAHLWSYSGILAAPFIKRWMNVPYLFHLILRTHQWPGRVDRWLFQQLLTHANEVAALTPEGAAEVRQQYGVDAISLSPPVDMDSFTPCVPTDIERPRVLFTGDLGDPRKGGPLLLRAWDEIHRRCPDAVLVLAGPFGLGFDYGFDVYTLERLDLIRSPLARDAVEIVGAGALADLPYQYSRASVTVLPSVDEAFGMVVTESLSCGTPVVCSSFGGPGEIVTSPDIGITVPLRTHADLVSERAARQVADAVLQGIDLSRRPGTAARCREWAEPWSLERVGLSVERVLAEIAETTPVRRKAAAA